MAGGAGMHMPCAQPAEFVGGARLAGLGTRKLGASRDAKFRSPLNLARSAQRAAGRVEG